MKRIISFIFTTIILIYQKFLSPLLQPTCRYTPTCSQYSLDAIKKHGPWKGGRLAIQRIFSCHPWGRHGHDPVP